MSDYSHINATKMVARYQQTIERSKNPAVIAELRSVIAVILESGREIDRLRAEIKQLKGEKEE